MTFIRTAAASLATTFALGFATFTFVMPAHAATMPAPAARHADAVEAVQLVHYGDLDLASDEGRAVLRKRVNAAVRDVCNTIADQSDPMKSNIAFERCREEVGSVAAMRVAGVLGHARLAQR